MDLNSIENVQYFIRYITGTPAWNALQDKTQVFNTRVNDQVTSRGKHCEDVANIALHLCKAMGGSTLEQRRAYLIGLAHDLGHIPFGHAGESVADKIISSHKFTQEERKQIIAIRRKLFGDKYVDDLIAKSDAKFAAEKAEKEKKFGRPLTEEEARELRDSCEANICFEHNENSVLQLMILAREAGVKLDEEIILGIIAHSTSRYPDLPPTLPEQAVRLADKIAYINFDVNDLFISFEAGKEQTQEELAAVRKMYTSLAKNPIKDPYGNELVINVGGRSYTIAEFLQMEPQERIQILIMASVEDAERQKAIDSSNPEASKYPNYRTILTGCNDLAVQIASHQKKVDNSNTSEEEKEKHRQEIARLKMELYKRSPIMYAAYEIKERSDGFIRAGTGLSPETQARKSAEAKSSVGNEDLKNEFIYKTLIETLSEEIEACRGLTYEQVMEKYKDKPHFLTIYTEYLEYRNREQATLLGLPENDEGLVNPEICTILNFIGTKSNTEILYYAKLYHIDEKFEREVLPKIQELMSDKELYDESTGLFTGKGIKERGKIVRKYGVAIDLKYGLEEENISVLADEVYKKIMSDAGFTIEGRDMSGAVTDTLEKETIEDKQATRTEAISKFTTVQSSAPSTSLSPEEQFRKEKEDLERIIQQQARKRLAAAMGHTDIPEIQEIGVVR